MARLTLHQPGLPALRDRFPDLDRCPDDHPINDVTVLCPECDRFVLFLPLVYQRRGRARPLLQGMIIVLSAVIALVVFRYAEVVWPLYWFLLLGIVHLYAIAFTRGAALGSATWVLSAVTAISIAWAVIHPLVPSSGLAGTLAHAGLRTLPVLGWLFTTVYMFLLGQQALSGIRIASSYFLAAATLTLGFWGVWLFYLENDLVTRAIYRVAVGVGLLLPVLCIAFLFTLPGRSGWERQRWLLGLGAYALIVLAANLIVTVPVVTALDYLLNQFFPRLVGVAPLNDNATDAFATDWLGGPGWRTAATSATLLVAAALVVVRATLEASRLEARSESDPPDDPGTEPRAPRVVVSDQVIVGEVLEPGAPSTTLARVEPSTTVAAPQGPAHQAYRGASFLGKYLGEIAYLIIKNILDALRHALQAVLPSVAFSLLAMLIVLVLGKLGEYVRHGPFLDALSLWGMVLSILVGAVLLCAIAFDFAPSHDRRAGQVGSRKPTRILGVPLAVIAAGTLLTSLAYSLVSLATWALLPMLWPGTIQPRALFFGDPYVVNLTISTVAIGLLAGLFAIGREADGEQARRHRIPGGLFSIPAALILLAVTGASIYFAAGPIRSTFTFVNGQYSSAAALELRNRLPAGLAVKCSDDYLLVAGQSASVACRDPSGTDVSYHAFDSADHLKDSYSAALHARGVTTGTASCAQQAPAEDQPPAGGGTGQVACYVDRRGAWLLWTDGTTLGIAHRSDSGSDELYSDWSSGRFSLRPL